MRDTGIHRLIKQQQIMMEQATQSKSVGVAYLLLFFLGLIGAHRFYLGRAGTAILFYWVGWVTLILPFIAWVIDLFILHEIVRKENLKLLETLNRQPGASEEGYGQAPEGDLDVRQGWRGERDVAAKIAAGAVILLLLAVFYSNFGGEENKRQQIDRGESTRKSTAPKPQLRPPQRKAAAVASGVLAGYDQHNYPNLYKMYGTQGVRRLEKSIAWAAKHTAKLAGKKGYCTTIEIATYSDMSTSKRMVFWVQCRNGRRFYYYQHVKKGGAIVRMTHANYHQNGLRKGH